MPGRQAGAVHEIVSYSDVQRSHGGLLLRDGQLQRHRNHAFYRDRYQNLTVSYIVRHINLIAVSPT